MRVIGRVFLWLFAVVGFFIIVVATSLTTWFILSGEEQESLPSRMVLSLDLNAGVSEVRPRSPFSILSPDKSTSLRDIVAGLQKAETDDRVAGIVVRMGSSGVGITKAQEIRAAIERVRKAGKFAVAYADSFSAIPGATSEYYLASGFDEIWMQPSGEMMTTGIVIEVPFVADALDKIGVQARMEQRKEFKSAPETFTRESMSAPARANLQDLVNSWFGQLTGGIAAGRSIDAAAAQDAIDSAPLLSGDAVTRKLIDKLGYWPEVAKAVKKRGGADAKLVTYANYIGEGDLPFTSGPTVALVYGMGPIVSGDVEKSPLDEENVFAATAVANSISAAAKDPDVK
ncbi:MAG: S49 family peptidase, partial [Pseudomonadota bacterium]